jgi:hypothetical protein
MDYLLSFFLLIISSIIGISIGLLLNIKSYLKIAIIVVCLFIPAELYNDLVISKKHKSISATTFPNINILPNTTNAILPTVQVSSNVNTNDANIKFARQKDLEDTKYGIFKKKDAEGNDKSGLPLDGLSPKDLLASLNYLTYATANPYKPLSFNDYKTHADKYLDEDGTKLSTNDLKLQEFSKAHYPQLTNDQIDTRDCLNFGSGKNSCFQSAQLFSNVNNNFSILNKGVNEDNSNLIIKEDFTNPMILDSNDRYKKILFKNAPTGNLDRILDGESNESINLDNSGDACRNCKLAVCKNDYCSLQNQLFM